MAARSRRICCTVTGAQPRLALIPAALQHVLDLQPQPAGKAAHVDPLAPEAGIGAGGGELAGLGPAARRQPWQWVWQNGVVGIAHRSQPGTAQASGGGEGGA